MKYHHEQTKYFEYPTFINSYVFERRQRGSEVIS